MKDPESTLKNEEFQREPSGMDVQTSDQTERSGRTQKEIIYNSLSKKNESKHQKMGGNPFVFSETFTKGLNQVHFSSTDKENWEHCTESLF